MPLAVDGEAAAGERFSSGSSFEVLLSTQQASDDAWQSRPPTAGPGRPASTLPQQPPGITDTSVDQPPGPSVNRQPSPLRTPQVVDTASEQFSSEPAANSDWTQSPVPPGLIASPGAVEAPHAKPARPSRSDTPKSVPVRAGQEAVAGPSTPITQQGSLSVPEHRFIRTLDEPGMLFDAPQSQGMTHPGLVSDHTRSSSALAMPVVQPHVTLYREAPVAVPSEEPVMAEPGPTIKITIGRVDVKAIMPPAAAPRPARTRPKPTLSLEDYLRQRGGDRR
jgi:hypothetical protein